MSFSEKIKLACPKCGNEKEMLYWASINVTQDPEKKKDLWQWNLNVFSCEKCSFKQSIAGEFIYHDMDKKIMIACIDNFKNIEEVHSKIPEIKKHFSGLEGINEYKLRVVYARHQLLEKINLFDFDLDDRVVELQKFLLSIDFLEKQKKDLKIVLCDDIKKKENKVESASFEILCADGERYHMDLPFESYANAKMIIDKKLKKRNDFTGEWIVADDRYIYEVLLEGPSSGGIISNN